jgi:hypothetical protein
MELLSRSKRANKLRQQRIDQNKIYRKYSGKNIDESEFEEEFHEPEIETRGIDILQEKRLIPIGKIINVGRPHFMKYPPLTKTSYNVFTFVSPMGGGKCYPSSVVTHTKEYGLITAGEMYQLFHQGKEIHVVAYQDKSKPIWSKITGAMYSGEKELHKVIVEGGSRIEVSMDHIMLVWRDGIKSIRLKEVTTDDWVLFPKKIDVPEWSDPEKEEHARMCGIFIADGHLYRSLQISNNKYGDFIVGYLAKYDISYRITDRKNCRHYNMNLTQAAKFKMLIGITKNRCVAGNKTVPAWIFTNKAYMRAFIQGLMECDGSFTTQSQGKDRKGNQKPGKRHRIELIMKSRQVVNSVAQMLLAFGIRTNYRTKMSKATNSDMEPQEYYSITVQGNDNLKKYLEHIPAYTDFQKDRIKDWDISSVHNSNMRYNLGSWMDKAIEAMRELKIAGKYWDYIKGNQLPSDNHRFRDLLQKLDEGGFKELADEAMWLIDNYYMAKIISIESIGFEEAYDFEVRARNLLAGDGCGMFVHNSTNVRNLVYYHTRLEPDCINFIFDPMKMEFSLLGVKDTNPKKQLGLMDEILYDEEENRRVRVKITPDNLSVFHVIPRFALNRESWDQEEQGYTRGYDKTSIEIMNKDGGFIFAEDIARMSEEQIFNCLNYRENRQEQSIHFYLRSAITICNSRHGEGRWFVTDLIEVLRESVRKFSGEAHIEDEFDMKEEKTTLSSVELQLIEQLEKYKTAGFFVLNDRERKKYCVDWRLFVKLGKVINISFMGYRKTDKIGEDLVRGQSDLILERLIEISNEYYDATRKVDANKGDDKNLNLTNWEQYLLKKWKVSLFFEESEVFVPRDCNVQQIKKWPCIKRLDYLMSFGRKYGFKNFGFITQRISKVNPMVFKESSHLFIGPIIGEERDQILKDFGVDKIRFPMHDKNGQPKIVALRDVVSGLSKDKHEWIFIDKGRRSVAAVMTYDSPCG